MSDDGMNIVAAMRQVTKLYTDVAFLLRTVDEQILAGRGWTPYSNNATAETSNSIRLPEKWMPRFAFRLLEKAAIPNIIAYVSIILAGSTGQEFDEPVIAAGYYMYDGPVNDRWEWWYMRIAEWQVDQKADGIREIPVESVPGAGEKGVIKIGLISLPLVTMKTSNDVKVLLIDRLMNAIEKQRIRKA